MGELQRIDFSVRRQQDAVAEMFSTDKQHMTSVSYSAGGGMQCHCSCGNKWYIPPEKSTEAECFALFNAHLSYYHKPPTVVL